MLESSAEHLDCQATVSIRHSGWYLQHFLFVQFQKLFQDISMDVQMDQYC